MSGALIVNMVEAYKIVAYAVWRGVVGLASIAIVLALESRAANGFQTIVVSSLVLIYARVQISGVSTGFLITQALQRLHDYGLKPEGENGEAIAAAELELAKKETTVSYIDLAAYWIVGAIAVVNLVLSVL